MHIAPTVGRSIHYHPAADHPDHGQTLVALIAKVNPDGTLNLAIFDSCGHHFSRQRVALIQCDDATPEGMQYCTWMPFQVGQASKTEEAEHALRKQRARFAMDQAVHKGDEMFDATSSVYDEKLPPNTGWIRNTEGDSPRDRFDENGVVIADYPRMVVGIDLASGEDVTVVPVLGESMAMTGGAPATTQEGGK